MSLILKLISGGFLAGKRTYLLGFILFAQAVVAWLVGDTTLIELGNQLPELIGGLGLMTLRAGMAGTPS